MYGKVIRATAENSPSNRVGGTVCDIVVKNGLKEVLMTRTDFRKYVGSYVPKLLDLYVKEMYPKKYHFYSTMTKMLEDQLEISFGSFSLYATHYDTKPYQGMLLPIFVTKGSGPDKRFYRNGHVNDACEMYVLKVGVYESSIVSITPGGIRFAR